MRRVEDEAKDNISVDFPDTKDVFRSVQSYALVSTCWNSDVSCFFIELSKAAYTVRIDRIKFNAGDG